MADFAFGADLDLPYGIRLRAVEVGGRVGDVLLAPAAGTPVRDAAPGSLPEALDAAGQPGGAAALLGAAAERVGMRREYSLPLTDLVIPPAAGGGTRGPDESPHIELTVPGPAEDEGQVVLEIDDTGVVRWHPSVAALEGTGVDRAGPIQTFRIPVAELDIPDAPAGDRGIVGFGLRKVLQIIRFPVEAAAGAGGELAVGWWERRNRPYGLDLVTAETIRAPLVGPGVSAARLDQLADRPFLLLVHGAFSRTRSGFDGLVADAGLYAQLEQRYDGRVLAFDHPTLHVDPDENVSWFLERLPDTRPLTLDVLCHSRGGLVGRRLSAKALADRTGRPVPVVRKLVHVATPNAGTVLAGPQRWGTLLDVFTNVLSLFPDSPVGVGLEGVLEVVKQVATGVLGGLDGIAAMDPDGPWLRHVEVGTPGPGVAVHAVTSDFEPAGGAKLAVRALDLLVDPIFGAGNDTVVPTDGVHRGAGGYTVADPLVVPTARGVAHSTYFHDPGVRAALGRLAARLKPPPGAPIQAAAAAGTSCADAAR